MTQAPSIKEALTARAQAFLDRKYVTRSDARQKAMGLGYIEAERQDLAREVARFCESEVERHFAATLQPSGERRTELLELAKWARAVPEALLADNSPNKKRFERIAEILEALVQDAADASWQCATRKQSSPEPADCNWPMCGCDPYADKVIAAMQESGFVRDEAGIRADEREKCAKIADRIAEDHEDGRDACMSEGPPNTKGALTQARQAQTAASIAAAIRSARGAET